MSKAVILAEGPVTIWAQWVASSARRMQLKLHEEPRLSTPVLARCLKSQAAEIDLDEFVFSDAVSWWPRRS